MGTVRDFMDMQFRHFNARETVDAARGWIDLMDRGGKMFLAMAGAMSTGELGITLAKMIRAGKISAVSCTAANFEEDIFNLLYHDDYKMVPRYPDLSPEEEEALYNKGFNRVTDTCIPESVIRFVDKYMIKYWAEAAATNSPKYPHELIFRLLDEPGIEKQFHVPREHSWVLAAKEMGTPVFVPGWEDSTLGNIFTAQVIKGTVASHNAMRTGTEQLQRLAKWYQEQQVTNTPVGFFQIGGGIAGDFSICVVPMLIQDLKLEDTSFWAYFCQISDAVTSYGSYSGAVPNEKITWGKLAKDTPKFMINSDASIVAPLIFAYVLGM